MTSPQNKGVPVPEMADSPLGRAVHNMDSIWCVFVKLLLSGLRFSSGLNVAIASENVQLCEVEWLHCEALKAFEWPEDFPRAGLRANHS